MRADYDGIILAAGKNTRLRDVVPAYYKPLVVINGRPLIVTLTVELKQRCDHVIIVVSPENSAPIADVLRSNGLLDDRRVTFIVQPYAAGPGDAVLRALRASHADRLLLVLGDNIIPHSDFDTLLEVDRERNTNSNAITLSVTHMYGEAEALRFTRVVGDQFIEGVDGGKIPDRDYYRCWIGPVAIDPREFRRALLALAETLSEGTELKLSPAFNLIPNRDVTTVEGECVDIGTSEALVPLTQES